jgi:hypothetical protein
MIMRNGNKIKNFGGRERGFIRLDEKVGLLGGNMANGKAD